MRSPHRSPLRALWVGHAGWRSTWRLQGRTASLMTLPTGAALARTSKRTTGADDGRARTAGLEGFLGACAHSAAPGLLLQDHLLRRCPIPTSIQMSRGAPSLGLAGTGEKRGAAASAHAAAAAPPAGLPCRRRQRSAAPPGAPPAGAPGPACQPRAGPGRPPAPPQLCEWGIELEWCAYAGTIGRKGANLRRPAKMINQSWQGASCAPAGPAPAARSRAPRGPWPRPCPDCTPWHAGEDSPRGNISGQTVGVTIMQAPVIVRKQISRTAHAGHRALCLGPRAQRPGGAVPGDPGGPSGRLRRPRQQGVRTSGRTACCRWCNKEDEFGWQHASSIPSGIMSVENRAPGRAHLAKRFEELAAVDVGLPAHARDCRSEQCRAHGARHCSHSTSREQ